MLFHKRKKKLIFNSPFFFHFVLRFLIFFYGFFFLRKSSRKGKMFAFFSIDGFREIVKSFWFRNIKKKLFPGQLFFFFFFKVSESFQLQLWMSGEYFFSNLGK